MASPFWISMLLTFGCALGTHYHSPEYGYGNISIRFEQLNSEQNRTIICTITDHRQVVANSLFQSSIIPRFRKISIRCDMTNIFLSSISDCKIVDLLGHNPDEVIMQVNSTLHNLINLDMLDVLIKFESIFAYFLSFGKIFVRCAMPRPHILENFNCSLFGIADQISTSANLTCFVPQTYMDDGNATYSVQCAFSEDHTFGKLGGNLTIELKLISFTKKITADISFDTHSRSPRLNVQETLRMDCREVKSDNGTEIHSCGVYLNQRKSIDHLLISEGDLDVNGHEIVVSDELLDLDSKITLNIDHAGLGGIQFVCNMAMEYPNHILKCRVNNFNGSLIFDYKAIIDMTYNSSLIYIDSMELVLINVTDKFHFHGIVIERCHVGHNKLFCEIQIGRNVPRRIECDIHEAQYEDVLTKYPVVCNIHDFSYTVNGTIINSRSDPNIIQLTFTGQFKFANRPEISHDINASCTIENSSESFMDNSGWNVNCNSNINIEDLCTLNATLRNQK